MSESGPPAPYDAGPGLAPALCGPTANRPCSTRQIEPPPAATVSMARAGVASVTGPTWCENTYSKSPSNRATSVLVPAHVEGDDLVDTELPAGNRGADDASRRPAQEAVHRPIALRGHQPAGAGHDVEAVAPRTQPAIHRAQIVGDHRAQGRRRRQRSANAAKAPETGSSALDLAT